MKVYKIRNGNEKYPYLAAGCRVSKYGKTWSNIGHVKNALKLRSRIPDSWIVEEYELVKVDEYSAKELIDKKEKE